MTPSARLSAAFPAPSPRAGESVARRVTVEAAAPLGAPPRAKAQTRPGRPFP